MSGVSSSSCSSTSVVSSAFWSRVSVVPVVWSCVVSCVVVVVMIGVVRGSSGLFESTACEVTFHSMYHVELSSAIVSQVMSLVRSLLSTECCYCM